MQAKDSRQGYPVYIFDRKEIKVNTGKITNSPVPHFDNRFPGSTKMVVELYVECDGTAKSYVVDDTSEVSYAGNLVITLNRESLLREIQTIKTQSEEALKMVEWNKSAVEKCHQLMSEYSPEYKERNEYSERIAGVESRMDKLAESVEALVQNLQKGGIR